MEKENKLESDIIFEKYTKDNVSYNKLMLSLFQDLKGKNFIFNKTKKTKKDLIKNMEKNINNLVKHIKELDENEFIEIYRCLSCIFGAFLGDAIGAYCEFKKPSKQNINNIFKGNPMFGDSPGQVTDDSEMAMSSGYAIMENKKLELDSNYLYYFYGLWHMSMPKDEGITTRKALFHFTKVDHNKFNLSNNNYNDIFKDIEKNNKKSLANGFLMRTSPIIVYLYFKLKNQIALAFDKKDEKELEDELYSLFVVIKSEVHKDEICTHPNESICISHSIFCIMSLGAIYGLTPIQIINNIKSLLKNEFFNGTNDYGIKDIIMEELNSYEKDKSLCLFDKGYNYFTDGNKKVSNHMGYYVHAFRLTLYYLFFFDKINKEEKYTKYRVIMNQICSFGGDTDTNAAIVGTVIGPLIGYKNFGDEEFLKMVKLVPIGRFIYSPALMIIYVYFIKNNINNDNQKGNYFLRIILKLLYDDIDFAHIFNNKNENVNAENNIKKEENKNKKNSKNKK